MKKNKPRKDFVAEAEKIIHSYINRRRQSAYAAFAPEHKPKPPNLTSLQKHVASAGKPRPAGQRPAASGRGAKRRKRNSGLDLFLNLVMIVGCLVIVAMLAFSMI